ncbi:MAG: hypothetical protein ABII96_02295 [Candidatus Zixiibacteriota bacterium]
MRIEIYTQVKNLELLGGLPVGKSEKKIKMTPVAPDAPVPPGMHPDIEDLWEWDSGFWKVSKTPLSNFPPYQGGKKKSSPPENLMLF